MKSRSKILRERLERWKKKKNSSNVKLKDKIVFRMYIYFAVIVSVFAISLGIIYGKLYERSTVKSFRSDLVQKAQRISECVSKFSNTDNKQGFNAYLEAVTSIFDQSSTDMYIIAKPNSQYSLSSDYTNYMRLNMNDDSIPEETREVLEKGFMGENGSNSGYDPWYYGKVVRVCVPVVNAGGNVNGVVMIISKREDQEMVRSSTYLIFVSSIAALLLSLIVSVLLATQISEPISLMGKTALLLAAGNYDVKLNLKVKGELGELLRSINTLSGQLKENEKMRENMEQMRRDFFANVSHELRTPITVIRGYSEMLTDGVVQDEEQKIQYYQRQLEECKSIERLVGDLLLLSKMQNPDFHIQMEPVNLVQVFQEIVRNGRIISTDKKLIFNLDYDNDTIMVNGDYDRLRQMFMIIVDNAIKFSNEGGWIRINLFSKSEYIKVNIEDNGSGIAESELPYIFEKFYKSKLKQNKKGSGLGLVIAKQIALKHHANISIKSKLGEGTLFEFSFDKASLSMV